MAYSKSMQIIKKLGDFPKTSLSCLGLKGVKRNNMLLKNNYYKNLKHSLVKILKVL